MAERSMLEHAEQFMWANARLLERHLFAFLFRNGPADPVRTALCAYQNTDGGFGNALEPDKRSSNSQPIDQEMALHILDLIGVDEAIVQPMCDFLSTISTAEGGVPFVLTNARDAPRAPWWNTNDNPPASLNPTASIVGLLHKHGIKHAWLDRATNYCWQTIGNTPLDSPDLFLTVITFLEHVPDRPRAQQEFNRITKNLFTHNLVEIDPNVTSYVKMPLDYAPTPRSWCRRLFSDEVIATHLAALANRQQVDGGWPISWPPVSPACEQEYRGIVTIKALQTLFAYRSIAHE